MSEEPDKVTKETQDEKPKPSKLKRLIRVALDLFFLAGIGGFQDFFGEIQISKCKKSVQSWPCDLYYNRCNQ